MHLLWILMEFLLISQVSAAPTVDVQSEAGCILSCSNEYGQCLTKANGLWHEYQHNRARIQAIVRRCCLYNEKNPAAKESDSFAACVRLRCGAMLYGCQIKKVHEDRNQDDDDGGGGSDDDDDDEVEEEEEDNDDDDYDDYADNDDDDDDDDD
ncbi:unnamed protein product, partial [Schistocephalus solidus]|uniref:Basic tail protein n=1 Tax=Schistocephalus solidus TaxID=70667 RepID=A0A183TJ42_SCHSO